MTIREVKQSDFEDLSKLHDEGYDELDMNPNFGDYLRLSRPSYDDKANWFSNMYRQFLNGDILYFVAEERGKVIGFCFVIKLGIPDSEISHAGELGIRVSKDFRRKGIGTELVKYVLEKCKGKFDIIEVGVMDINETSKKLFRNFNFKTWGIAPGFVKRNGRYIDVEHMCLKL